MANPNRALELSQSLITLQRQYNEMVETKDKWREKAIKVEETSKLARERLLTILTERDEEIELLKKTLTESRELVELLTNKPKAKTSRNAKGTKA
jgi:paraquat-inducible protein B